MRIVRQVTRFGALSLLATLAVAGCATDRTPSAPANDVDVTAPARPRTAVPGLRFAREGATTAAWTLPGVRREHPLAEDVTVAADIGPEGGSLAIREAGFTLAVPRGAVATRTRFTVTALAGDLLAYDFGPTGATFPIPLEGTQDLRGTSMRKLPRNAELRLGYFTSPSDVDGTVGTAAVRQEQPVAVEAGGHRLGFRIPHFSGWIILWRGGEPVDSVQQR